MVEPGMIIAWEGGTTVAGDPSPRRHVHRYTGTVYRAETTGDPTLPSTKAKEIAKADAPAGEFSVAVIDGLSAYVEEVLIKAVCQADGRLGELHRLFTDDWQWTDAVEKKLRLNVDWVPNLIYFERLLLYRDTPLAGREEALADALTLRFGTGCSAACIGLDTFDLGWGHSDAARAEHGHQRLYNFERNLGWRKVAGLEYWIKDTQLRGA